MATTATRDEPVLSVDGLRVGFSTDAGVVKAVDGVSWAVRRGETLAIVGESGSGKSASAHAVMGLLREVPGCQQTGQITFDGRDLLQVAPKELRRLRGNRISMIFQDPLTSLNPAIKVGRQIAEVFQVHRRMSRTPARRLAVELLADVGIPHPESSADAYPHELSGGMRQRAMIAMAVALDPLVLIADEPTTALDVTVQAQIMHLLSTLQADRGTAMVLITHDLGLVAGHADRVLVMYAGRAAEVADVDTIYHHPRHAYTSLLLAALVRLDQPRTERLQPIAGQPPSLIRVPSGCPFHPRCPVATAVCERDVPALVAQPRPGHAAACHHTDEVAMLTVPLPSSRRPGSPAPLVPRDAPLLEVEHLVKHYPITSRTAFRREAAAVKAVDDISFVVGRREALALVGESGCGKSTTARAVLRLIEPTSGSVRFEGEEVTTAAPARMRQLRRKMQIVFQDAYASLDPRMTVQSIIAEPFRVHGIDEAGRVRELLEAVGLAPEHAGRYPHQLAGGQRQRVGIARALALEPELVICDEPVWALDVSTQGQVLNLLADLRRDRGLAYLFIAHDLSLVRHIADRVAVMYLGCIVEIADWLTVFTAPSHPYSQGLISAIPFPDPRTERRREPVLVRGDPPSALDPPSGCRFRTRCWKFAEELTEGERTRCVDERPPLIDRGQGHPCACHYAETRQLV